MSSRHLRGLWGGRGRREVDEDGVLRLPRLRLRLRHGRSAKLGFLSIWGLSVDGGLLAVRPSGP